MHNLEFSAQIHQLAQLGDAFAVHDVELRLPERGGHLVFHHLGLGAVADIGAAGLDMLGPADFDADAGIEFQRPAAGGHLRVAVHHAHLFPELVDEHHHAVGFGDGAGQLAQGLRHQPSVEAHKRVAHLALDFRLGHQGGHRVHHNHVDGAAAHQGLCDFQRLFASIRLGNQQAIHIHAQSLGVYRVQGVFRVDKSGFAAGLLGGSRDMQGQGGFARGFRAVNLHNAPPGHAADTQGDIQRHRACGDGLHIHSRIFSQTHDGALPIGFFNLRQGVFQCFFLIHRLPLLPATQYTPSK